MLKLCDTAMEQLKAKDYNHVLASLYEYTDSTQESSLSLRRQEKDILTSLRHSQCWNILVSIIRSSWKVVMM